MVLHQRIRAIYATVFLYFIIFGFPITHGTVCIVRQPDWGMIKLTFLKLKE
jgi:hypothetical protein